MQPPTDASPSRGENGQLQFQSRRLEECFGGRGPCPVWIPIALATLCIYLHEVQSYAEHDCFFTVHTRCCCNLCLLPPSPLVLQMLPFGLTWDGHASVLRTRALLCGARLCQNSSAKYIVFCIMSYHSSWLPFIQCSFW